MLAIVSKPVIFLLGRVSAGNLSYFVSVCLSKYSACNISHKYNPLLYLVQLVHNNQQQKKILKKGEEPE